MAATIIGASYYGTLRSRELGPYAVLTVLTGELPFTVGVSANECFMTYGPGATPAAPGTRLYWTNISGTLTVRYTDGVNIVDVPGAPSGHSFYFLYYDRLHDILYATYNPGGGSSCEVASFDGSSWTVLAATAAIGGTSGVISVVPPGSSLRPGKPIIAVDGVADTVQVVRSYTGSAWTTELTQHVTLIPQALVPYGDKMVLCSSAQRAVPIAGELLVQLRAANGTWTDITPASWAGVVAKRRAICATVVGTDLWVAFKRNDSARSEIWKRTSAGVWSMELDLVAEGTAPAGYAWSLSYIGGVLRVGMDDVFAGNYYLSIDIAGGGSWTRNTLPNDLQPPYFESSIQFFIESPEGTITPDNGNCSAIEAPTPVICGYWDEAEFAEWSGSWAFSEGQWNASPGVQGTTVWMGKSGAYARPIPPDGYFYSNSPTGSPDPLPPDTNLGVAGEGMLAGEIVVLDPFVLTCSPPNGYDLVDVALMADGLASSFPLYLPDAYTFNLPTMVSIAPTTGPIVGDTLITVTGTDFFEDQYPGTILSHWRTNRFFVETASGRVEEADPSTVVFVNTTTFQFRTPSFPGGTDPVVTVVFRPAGLPPFGQAGSVPFFVYPKSYAAYTYTSTPTISATVFAVLGSIDTVIGLGGFGADVIGPDEEGGLPASGGGTPSSAPDAAAFTTPDQANAAFISNMCSRVLYRLGDFDQKIWTEEEIDSYILQGSYEMVTRNMVIWDQLYLENLPAGFSRTAAWEVGLLEAKFEYGVATYTAEFEGDYGEAGDLWVLDDVEWANHTSPAELHFLESGGASTQMRALSQIPEVVTEMDRGAWDDRTLDGLDPHQLQYEDSRFEITAGEIFGFTWQKDGPMAFRKVRVPAQMARIIMTDGGFGIARSITTAYNTTVTGSWGIPRRIPSWHPIGGTVGFGLPRRFYYDNMNVKFEHWRRFLRDAKCKMTELVDGEVPRLAGEIPRHYFLYLTDYCQWKALWRNGPGQNYKMGQLYKDRWEREMGVLGSRIERIAKEKMRRAGGDGPSGGSGPPRPSWPWQFGSRVR